MTPRNCPLPTFRSWNLLAIWLAMWIAIAFACPGRIWGQSPKILIQPPNASTTIGGRVILQVLAQGEAPMAYQWSKDGADLSDDDRYAGTSSSNLVIRATTKETAGSYRARASNASGSTFSSNAVLAVTGPSGTLDVAYVVNRDLNSLSIISRETLTVLRHIPVGDQPLHVASSYDHRFVAVGNQGSHNVTLIDTQLGQSVATIPVGLTPEGMAWSRDNKLLFVVNSGSSSFSVIDADKRRVIDVIQTAPHPAAIALHPVRDELWLGFNTTGTVLEIRALSDYAVLGSIQSRDRAYASGGFAFASDGSSVWTTEGCGCCGRFHQLSGSVDGGTVNVIRKDVLGDNLGAASSVTIHPTTGEIYLAKTGHCNGGVPAVQEATGGRKRLLLSPPRETALDATRDQLWVTLAGGSIEVISASGFTGVASLRVGNDPFGIAMGSFNFGADLMVTPSRLPNPVTVGSNFLYTLTIGNAGPSTAEQTSLIAEFPMELQLLEIKSSQGITSRSGNQLKCDLGTLTPQTTATIQFTARASCIGRPAIMASVRSDTGDPIMSNNSIEPAEVYIDPLYTNHALNLSGQGFPTAESSDPGWGSANKPQELLDGARSYNTWTHGLAFTGGHQDENNPNSPAFQSPAGFRQATVDFGTNRIFEKVVLWHHGDAHTPSTTALDYWDGAGWISISFDRVQGRRLELGQDTGSASSDEYYFSPVIGSKLRYRFDNRERNVTGTWLVHGWLYEIEVLGRSAKQPPGGALTVRANGNPLFDGPNLLDNPGDGPVQVEIESCPAGSAIRYTVDGSLPSALSKLYEKSLSVLPPARIRAAIVQGNTAYGYRDIQINPLPYYTLDSTTTGGGNLLLPPGFKNPVHGGTRVELTAVPASGWSLTGWEGDTVGTGQVVHVVMTENRTVRAIFGRPLLVKIEATGEAGGAVVSNPNRPAYSPGDAVSLTAIPSPGSLLLGEWRLHKGELS